MFPKGIDNQMPMKTVHVEYFAVLRELVGVAGETLTTDLATPDALFAELRQRHSLPDVGRMKVAVNAEFADWKTALHDGDTVVFIPPVAGG
jgi:molybdopterin converting factor subunit 1